MKRLFCTIAVVVLTAPALRAENGVRPGEFIIEPPTLICLGFEWAIGGDDNRNATVDVSYRRAGDSQWREALPLLRMGGEKIFRAPYTVPDRFAGSILDLDPDTAYEVRLTMKDPDGVSGQAVQPAKVRTRGEPKGGDRRTRASRLPADLAGREGGAELYRPDGRVRRRRHGRLERRVSEQGRSGRRDPRACRPLQRGSSQLRRPAQHDVRWGLPADGEGHAGAADRDQSGWRR